MYHDTSFIIYITKLYPVALALVYFFQEFGGCYKGPVTLKGLPEYRSSAGFLKYYFVHTT